MKSFKSLAVLAVLGGSFAWADDVTVVSLHPLVTDKDPQAVLEPGLIGKWWDVEITADGDTGYRVNLDDDSCTLRLMRFNGLLVGDLRLGKNGLPVHIFMTLRVDGDELHVRFFGTKWLAETIRTLRWPRFETLEEEDGPGILLTASSSDLRRDLLVYFCDERALDYEITLQRMKAAEAEPAKQGTVQ